MVFIYVSILWIVIILAYGSLHYWGVQININSPQQRPVKAFYMYLFEILTVFMLEKTYQLLHHLLMFSVKYYRFLNGSGCNYVILELNFRYFCPSKGVHYKRSMSVVRP